MAIIRRSAEKPRDGPPKRKQRGFYLTAQAERALAKIEAESGKTRSDTVSDALVFFADWPEQIRRIVREELGKR